MGNLQFFDAHCYVGRYKTFRPGSFYSPSELIDNMDYYGIAEALVTHAMSREHHPADGNAAVLAATKDRDRLHPSWALLPTASRELPNPATSVRDMIAGGVWAARLFCGSYSFSLSDWCIGDLLDELEAHHMPTFIDPDVELDTVEPDLFDWNAVDALCRSHPKLPVIISKARFGAARRVLYQLLEAYSLLHVETSGLWVNRGIEFITTEFGANRLIFGTRMPVRDPACAVAQVTYAEVSEEDKKLIAGDNLRRLMGGVVE
ncbi:MAG: amidohydrolase family protein [Armatimonadota bacterium]